MCELDLRDGDGGVAAAHGRVLPAVSGPARPASKSRVLYISGTPLVPSKLGPARRNYHILGQLSRFYETVVLTVGAPTDARTIASSLDGRLADVIVVPAHHRMPAKVLRKAWRTATGQCDFLPACEPALRRACAQIATRGAFDAIVLSSVLLRTLPLPDDVRIVADTHNVEFDVHRRTVASADHVLRRLYAACQTASTRREERRSGARVELLLATSGRDSELFERELQLRNVAVVPNGIDLAEFQPATAPGSEPIILFSGLMSYYPNQQGIRWFLDSVFPAVRRRVPDARLVVAGAFPPRWLLSRQETAVEITGRVADMRPYLSSARAIIAPLMIGGGTRVKILEAQAMEKPVVSTSLGAEGLAQIDDETILIGDDAPSFARHVVRLLTDPVAAARIAHGGRRHVVTHFDWDRIGVDLHHLLQARLGLSGAKPGPSNQEHEGHVRAHRLPSLPDNGTMRAAQEGAHSLS